MNQDKLCKALMWASRHGYFEVVKLLLERGARIHADNDLALSWASRYGHTEVVNVLKESMNATV